MTGYLSYVDFLLNEVRGCDDYALRSNDVPLRMFRVPDRQFTKIVCRAFPEKCDIGPSSSFGPDKLWSDN